MSLRDWTILRQVDSDILKNTRLAFVFGVSGSLAFVVTRGNKVYTVGKNISYCLGNEKPPNSDDATVKRNSTLSKLEVKSFAAAYTKENSSSVNIGVVMVTKDGNVYHWGSRYGNLRHDQTYFSSPQPVLITDKVKEVACGASHFLALSELGKVYSWGSNDKGQLGFCVKQSGQSRNDAPDCITEVAGPIQAKFVVEISCGSHFSLALIDNGTIFSWGCNKYGQLGIQLIGEKKEFCPSRVPLSNAIKIRRIACGPAHVFALSGNGELYGWGRNDLYQLGHCGQYSFNIYYDYKYIDCAKPCKISLHHRVTDIGASYLHELSVAETDTNEIFFWGQSCAGVSSAPTVTNYESIDEAFAYLTQSMHKPLIIPENKRITMAESLGKELGNKETADLVIQTGSNEEIYVHKTILKMRSNYFKTKLPKLLEKNDKIIRVESNSFPAMKAYLRYVYTDKLEVDLDLAIELFRLAEKFDDNNFKILCERNIKRKMTPQKVAELYSATRTLAKAGDLNKFCLEYAVRHAGEVMESPGYKNWDLDTLQTFVPEYVKSRGY